MALFLRLWVTRHRYEQLRPFGRTSRDCLTFHLRQLQSLWARVLSCQRALALEVAPFTPREHFEAVYIISGYVQREIENPRNAAFELTARWREYVKHLGTLSHDINPFEFGDSCSRCARLVDELNGNFDTEIISKVIPMPSASRDLLNLGRAAMI